MQEDFFEFLEFKMLQAPSGQRINTDSCSFAALIGEREMPKRILDIGTGTGVVALMLASRFSEAAVIGVEPEADIVDIAGRNFAASPWSTRLSTLNHTAQSLDVLTHGRFDFIACNPPYFQNSMLSSDRLRQVARHTTTLTADELFAAFLRLLEPGGTCWMSCPGDARDKWIACGKSAGLSPFSEIHLHDHPQAKPHVAIFGWSLPGGRSKCDSRSVYYRVAEKGEQSPWMKEFRNRWYPARFSRSN